MTTETGKALKEYEIAYLIASPDHEAGVLKILERHGVEAVSGGSARAITLAYPIRKHTSAYFGVRIVKADPGTVPALENELRLDPHVLRALLIKTPKLKPMPAPRIQPTSVPEPVAQIKSPASDTITNEALEQKLEEILRD